MIDLKPACTRVIDLLADVTDDQLTRPTPCTEYSVSDLLAHLDQVSRGFAALARAESDDDQADTATEPDGSFSDGWRVGIAAHLRELGDAWDDPTAWQGTTNSGGVDLPNALWGKIALTEVVVHGWDLATATHQPFDLPEQTLRACRDHVAEFIPNAPVPDL